jgi:dienelactone hydrolase
MGLRRLGGRCLLAGFVSAVLCAACTQPSRVPGAAHDEVGQMVTDPVIAEAQQLYSALVERRFDEVVRSFSDQLRAELPSAVLELGLRSIQAQFGDPLAITGSEVERGEQGATVTLVAPFTHGTIHANFVFDSSGRVTGLSLTEPPDRDGGESPAAPDGISEREFAFGDEWRLPGTLTLPSGQGPFAAAVLVHGSGPQDRDETLGPNKPFRDLAWGLASLGIAVLRYDKRTFVHRTRLSAVRDSITPVEETIADAVEAFESLAKLPVVDQGRIVMIGHSLGATLMPRIAQLAPGVRGFVLLAPAASPLEDVLLQQAEFLARHENTSESKELLADIRKRVARVKDPMLSRTAAPSDLPLGIPAAYWLWLRDYDPISDAERTAARWLLLFAGQDFNVPPSERAVWESRVSTQRRFEFKSYPDLNHLFISGAAPGRAGLSQPGHVSGQVISDMAAWINSL